LPTLLRSQLERGIASIVGQRQHLGEERSVLNRGRSLRQHCIELVEPRLRGVVVHQTGGAFHLADDRIKRAVRVLRRAEIAEARVRLGGEVFQQRSCEPRFPDAGLAGEQHDLAFTRLCSLPAPKQQFEFFIPPDENGQTGRVQRLETAFRGTRPQRREGPLRTNAPEIILNPEIFEIEQIGEKFSGAAGDDNGVGLGQRLQAHRKVRRVADDRIVLLGRTVPDEVADDHEPSRDPDTHLQRRTDRAIKLRYRLDEGKPGPHGALSIMLVGPRIAKIGEHSIAHVPSDETAVALD
jgi:hypothetical protein